MNSIVLMLDKRRAWLLFALGILGLGITIASQKAVAADDQEIEEVVVTG